MSKCSTQIRSLLIAVVWVVIMAAGVRTQSLEVELRFEADGAALVAGRYTDGSGGRNLSFASSAIGAPDLGRRISGLTLGTGRGESEPKRLQAGEFVAEGEIVTFSYRVDLAPGQDPRSAAHASWIAGGRGILFLHDLLPLPRPGDKGLVFSVVSPAGWNVEGSEQRVREGVYHIRDRQKAVFLVGKALRKAPVSASPVDLFIDRQWGFTDVEAAGAADEIFTHYAKVFGGRPSGRASVAILPFPQAGVRAGTWEAETSGNSIVLITAEMPFQGQAVQRLHEQLRHEMFHLWLPNGVNLSGRYDWFYEGFALYMSLRAGVQLNRIRFEDMLDTLSRALAIDRANPVSLIEASGKRFAGAETTLYARGMLLAFLADLELLSGSRGKRSAEELLRDIFRSHQPSAPPAEGTEAIISRFERDAALSGLVRTIIRGTGPVEAARQLEQAGIENVAGTSAPALRIKSQLSGRQKAILDELGYNNWRKLLRR